ncbi:MAG TPA: response regulator [bacterium]|nr:response regulator [bacterium]HPJ72071.1 response regulator [bacterium]
MPYNILLVDDDKDFCGEFREFFSGYRVITAADGEEALAILKKPHEIDLVILDVNLPGLHGIQVLKRIKQSSPSPHVVILTGYGSKNIVIGALKGEADDYLEKPLDAEKTKLIIENLRRAAGGKRNLDSEDMAGKIERIKLFLKRNRHKKVTLDDVAGLVCLSPKYVSRVFRETTGEGFNEYKLRLKIEQAREWLRDSGHNVASIAYSLGYLNPESFIRIFKKNTGMTPSDYRNRAGRTKQARGNRPKR